MGSFNEINETKKMQNAEMKILDDEVKMAYKGLFIDDYDISNNKDDSVERKEQIENKDIDTLRYIITRNESLDGDIHPLTGVPFEKIKVELENGEKVEGVFPKFEYEFEASIPKELYNQSDYKQFKYCNEQLLNKIDSDIKFKEKFNEIQIEQIKEGVYDGTSPEGFVWHHSPESGKIQLVDFETHEKTGHTGGRSIWGGGNEFR